VPPSVLNAGGVVAQTAEMIEYFKAWADQSTDADAAVVDYYCYLFILFRFIFVC
jgi:hypothetical protein